MQNWGFASGVLVGCFMILSIIEFFPTNTNIYQNGYKQGQIDSLTGKVHFQLKTKEDKTSYWEFVK